MGLRINKNTKVSRHVSLEDILPRICGSLTVKYAQKEYKVIGYIGDADRERLIMQDLQQHDYELIVEMDKVKPLLRKMESMTIDEKERYQELLDGITNQTTEVWEVTEWLNCKLFDYKDLIGQGLAEELIK